jgi:transposase-like protein
MERYNKMDILSLEELYHKLIPWDKSAVNYNLYTEDTENVCKCGSRDFKKNGFHYTETGKFQRWKCSSCGAESRDRENLFSKEKKASLRMGIK